MSRYQASELSNKVKVINLVEENILKKRLELYNRQERRSLRVIDKESKKVEADMKEKLLKPCSVFDWSNNYSFTEELLGIDKNTSTGTVKKKVHRNEQPKGKTRKLKKQKIIEETEIDKEMDNKDDEIDQSNEQEVDFNEVQIPDIRVARKVKFKNDEKGFLPDIAKCSSNNGYDTSSIDSEGRRRSEKSTEKLSLPSIYVSSTL